MRFVMGDEMGNIKTLLYQSSGESKSELKTVYDGVSTGTANGVQRLSVFRSSSDSDIVMLAAARADSSVSLSTLNLDDALGSVNEWKEERLKSGEKFIGLSAMQNRVYSCTSNGALRLSSLDESEGNTEISKTLLPMRLCDWKLSPDKSSFAYGGNEVDLSVWNVEQAFARRPEDHIASIGKKRKRGDDLLSGEIWRAKNVPNDNLGLRQPIHIAALTYLSTSNSSHLATGTHMGDVRRYDTRASRRPIADWKAVGRIGGIKTIEKGLVEHDIFVSDNGCNLFSLDLRNGRVAYSYKGLSGAVNSIAPAPSIIASTALDRFFRVHSTFPPPPRVGDQQSEKGQVLDKIFTKSMPTFVVWDGLSQAVTNGSSNDDGGEGDDKIWQDMKNVGHA